MTRLTNEQLLALRDGCEGVTEGAWRATGGEVQCDGPSDCDGWVATSSSLDASHIARCDPDTLRSLSEEVIASREAMKGLSVTTEEIRALALGDLQKQARIAEIETTTDEIRQEGYDEGLRDGRTEATGAHADFWTMALSYLKGYGVVPASDDGEGHNAYQMMDAISEHVHNVEQEKDARIAELEAALRSVLPHPELSDQTLLGYGDFALETVANAETVRHARTALRSKP